MPKKHRMRNIQLRFSGSRDPLRFSEVREFYLQAHGWKGISPKMQRERLERMHQEFVRLHRLFERVNAGERIKDVEKSEGISQNTLAKWRRGVSLPKLISVKFIQQNIDKRKKHLKEASLRNPRIGYVLGAILSRHLSVQTDKRGQVSIMSSVRKGSVEKEFEKAQQEVFGYSMESKTRHLKKFPSIVSQKRASSVEVALFLNEATFFGKHIPFHLLKKKSARKEFAMALVDSKAYPFQRLKPGRRKPEAGIRFKTGNLELRDYFIRILSEFGIKANPRSFPVLSKEEKWALFKEGKLHQRGKIYGVYIPKSELKKFKKKIGFREQKKAKMLDSMISQS